MAERLSLATRQFEMADQHFFASLSGDVNPMHVDSLYARRTQAGAPVVHGVHALLWALDAWFSRGEDFAFTGLRVRFERFVYLGATIEAVVADRSADRIDIELLSDGVRVAMIALLAGGVRASALDEAAQAAAVEPAPPAPHERPLESLEGLAGAFAFAAPAERVADAFPRVAAALGASAVASLGNLSTLVGMHCPGLFSIFSKLEVALDGDGGEGEAALRYRVRRLHAMFRTATIAAHGPGVRATIEAFVRQPPVMQPSVEALAPLVPAGAFRGARVLIVGGSRGIGEYVAKLLAAGGAELILTYARGAADAEAVAEAVRSWGGRCSVRHLDVAQPIPGQLADIGRVTHCYYFATPQIFRQRAEVYARDVLDQFTRFYLDAFYELVTLLAESGEGLSIFCPSSEAVLADRPKGATEYAIAKAGAEILCQELVRDLPGVDILVDRLPRLLTDQTATVLPVASAPLETLVPLVLKVQGVAAGA